MRALGLILITVVACQRSEPPPPPPSAESLEEVERLLDEARSKLKQFDVIGAREDFRILDDEMVARGTPVALRVKVCELRTQLEQATDFLDAEGALPWLDRCAKVASEELYPDQRLAILTIRAEAKLRAGKDGWAPDLDEAVDLATRTGVGGNVTRMQHLRHLVDYLDGHQQRGAAKHLGARLAAIAN